MTPSYPSRVRADVRLAILQALAEDLGHSMNNGVMRDAIEVKTAHSLTEDEIKEHFAWLEERGLARTEELDRFQMAVLTDRGMKIVQGKERIEGVRLPSVEERGAFL